MVAGLRRNAFHKQAGEGVGKLRKQGSGPICAFCHRPVISALELQCAGACMLTYRIPVNVKAAMHVTGAIAWHATSTNASPQGATHSA